MSGPGKVFLVGAGPGDPGLLTVAGLERLREADVVVYDRLVSPVLLKEASPDTELVFVGKVAGESHDQEAINRLIIEKAREGKRVVRLKGGDPFVFGRGGEEAEALRVAGLPFEVVPGVTSAVAVPAYAGIPVTHRGFASTFAVITGHEDPEKPELSIDWTKLATAVDTLVFLMGTKTLPDIVERLLANGRAGDTPVAVIRWGTTPEQRTVTGTLGDIVKRVQEAGITPPAITVVGEVVRLRKNLSWFEERPLFGKRVLITRTRRQASMLARLLVAEGAIPIELPAIEIEPVADPEAVSSAIEDLRAGRYTWAVFTSANAVELWLEHLRERVLDTRTFAGTKVAAIGPATAEALAGRGIVADLVPEEYVAEGVVEALRTARGWGPEPQRVLVPRAEGARPELVEGLRAAGAEVDEVTLYRAAVPHVAEGLSPQHDALSLLRDGAIDIVTFTSSSTVRNLVDLLVELGEGSSKSESAVETSAMSDEMVSVVGLEGVEEIRADHIIFWNEDDDVPPEFDDMLERSYNEWMKARTMVINSLLMKPKIACIGPITAETARDLGLRVDVEAAEHTVEGLVAAVKDTLLRRRK